MYQVFIQSNVSKKIKIKYVKNLISKHKSLLHISLNINRKKNSQRLNEIHNIQH